MKSSNGTSKKAENVAEESKVKKTRKSKKSDKKASGDGNLDRNSIEALAAEAADEDQDPLFLLPEHPGSWA